MLQFFYVLTTFLSALALQALAQSFGQYFFQSKAWAQTNVPATGQTPSPASTLSLDIDKAMELAQKNSFAARIANENVAEAEAQGDQTEATLGPRLDADGQKVWISKSVNKAAGKTIGTTYVPDSVTTAGITLSQPLVGLAALFLKIKADSLSTRISRNNQSQSINDARTNAAEAFLRFTKAEELVKISKLSLSVTEKQRLDADAQYRAGKLNRADVLRLELAVSDAKNQLTQAQSAREISLLSLGEQIGIPQVKSFTVVAPVDSMWERKKLSVPAAEQVLKLAYENRNEVKNAEDGITIAEYYKTASGVDYVPNISAFARYSRDFETKEVRVQPPLVTTGYSKKDIQDSFSYGLKFNWALWDWGSRWQRSNEYQAKVNKARIGKEGAESGVRLDATRSHLELQAAVESLGTSKTSVSFAEEVFRLTQVKFSNGSATATDLVAAERDQTRARAGLASARADVDLAWIKLQKAQGVQPSAK